MWRIIRGEFQTTKLRMSAVIGYANCHGRIQHTCLKCSCHAIWKLGMGDEMRYRNNHITRLHILMAVNWLDGYCDRISNNVGDWDRVQRRIVSNSKRWNGIEMTIFWESLYLCKSLDNTIQQYWSTIVVRKSNHVQNENRPLGGMRRDSREKMYSIWQIERNDSLSIIFLQNIATCAQLARWFDSL